MWSVAIAMFVQYVYVTYTCIYMYQYTVHIKRTLRRSHKPILPVMQTEIGTQPKVHHVHIVLYTHCVSSAQWTTIIAIVLLTVGFQLALLSWIITGVVVSLVDSRHSYQLSQNGRDSPGILGLVPEVSCVSQLKQIPTVSWNLHTPCVSTRLDGHCSANHVS